MTVRFTIRKACILSALLFAFAATVRSQTRATPWRVYRAADGLSENKCVSVAIGPRGKIWVSHSDGGPLSGLDGYNVVNISVPFPFHGRVYESPGGRLWLACDDGVEEYHDEKWIHYPVAEILRAHAASTNQPLQVPLCALRPNRIDFLLPDALVQLDIEDPNTTHTVTLLPASHTRLGEFLGLLASSRDESLWISGRHGLARAGPARNLRPDSDWHEFLPPEEWQLQNLREPVEDADGGITAMAESITSGQKVVVHFDGQQWDEHPVEGENVTHAWRGPDGNFWVATAESVFRLDTGNGLVPNEEDTVHHYYDLAVEPNGNFWLATSDGLLRYSPPVWQSPPNVPAQNSPVTAITRDQYGRLWFTSVSSLNFIHDRQCTTYPFPANIPADFSSIRRIFAVSNGVVVLAAEDHLLQFSQQTGAFQILNAPGKGRLHAIGLLGDASLCVQSIDSTPGSGAPQLLAFDGANFKPFPYPSPPDLGSELVLLAAPGGNIWLAGTKGIARYRDQKWQPFGPRDESMPRGITCMAEINDERIWCGLPDRIAECDGKNWLPVHGVDRVNEILIERDGGIWIACNQGVQRYQSSAWIANDVEEGLPSGIVSALCEDNSGRIWAGTARGLSVYHPEADPDPPQTSVLSPVQPGNSFPEGSSITVSFSALDKWKFTPFSRLLYSYRLDTNDWSAYQEGRSVTLPELPAFKHYFQVRSMDRNANQDANPALFEFEVVLPWYKESRLLLITFAGLVIVLFFAGVAVNRHLQLRRSHAEIEAQVALRTKQLQIANQELLHSQKMNALGTLAAGIAHDFNSILSIIKGSAQIIEDNLDNREKIRTRADRIRTVVEQGSGIVKAMLGFSRSSGGEPVMCNVNAIIGETVKLLGDRFLREVEVRFEPAPALPEVPVSPDFVQQILLNLVFNAAEAMTEHRQIVVTATSSNRLPAALVLAPAHASAYVFISVKDSGCGISPEILPRIFEPFFTTKSLSARRGTGLGLSMVYELARQMEAGLAVESSLGQGSTFTVILAVRDLPVDATPPRN